MSDNNIVRVIPQVTSELEVRKRDEYAIIMLETISDIRNAMMYQLPWDTPPPKGLFPLWRKNFEQLFNLTKEQPLLQQVTLNNSDINLIKTIKNYLTSGEQQKTNIEKGLKLSEEYHCSLVHIGIISSEAKWRGK